MEWIKIFSSAAQARELLAGSKPQLLVVDGIRICLVLHNDQLLAVSDRCTHNGESLSKGTINYLGEVVCPWHGYRFNLKTGRECGEKSADLATFPIDEKENGVFIYI